MTSAFRLFLLLGAFATTAGVAGEPLWNRKTVDALYDLLWSELKTNSSGSLTQPHSDPIRSADLRDFDGTYSVDYGCSDPSGVAWLTFQGDRYSDKGPTKLASCSEGGHWKLFDNKVILLRKRDADSTKEDDARGFVLRIRAQWYFCDLDLPRGIAPLVRKPDHDLTEVR